MKPSSSELGEGLEEDGDERLDVNCRLLCSRDGLAVLGVREPDAGGLVEEKSVLKREM